MRRVMSTAATPSRTAGAEASPAASSSPSTAAAAHVSNSDAGSDAAASSEQAAGSESGNASATNDAPVAPSDTLLSSSILLRRLAERQFTQQQVKKTVQHLLDTHAISHAQVAAATAAAAAAAVSSSGGATSAASPLAAPLTRAAYEVMLSALQEVQDLDTFEQVWNRMHTQFTTASSGSGASSSAASTPSSFHPSALMYLCRMSVLMAHRRLDQVEDTFRAWKRSSEGADEHELTPLRSLPTDRRPTPPNLLAFHLMLRRHLLASDQTDGAEGDPECAAKCMRLLQELKAAGSGTVAFDGQDDEEEWGVAGGPNPAAAASFRPVHLTFHLLLQSLLPRAMRDLRHLTPLLLDMEHQSGLEPDWNTYALALQVCQRAAEQARRVSSQPVAAHASKSAVKAAERQRKEATIHLQTAWAKGSQLFRSVQQHAEKTRKQAEQKRAEVIAKQKAAAAKADAAQKQPPPPPSVPSAASLIPAPLWFRYLSLTLDSREYDALFTALTSMQRDAMLIPPPLLIDPVLQACAAVAAMPAPPAPVFPPDLRIDDEDRALALRDWTTKARAHQALQQRALAATLQMLRCSATHVRMEADAAARRNASARPPPPPPSSSGEAAADTPAAPSTTPVPPTRTPVAATIPLAHYTLAFQVLSRLGRVDEFEKLWKHFMAQPPPLPLSDAVATTAAAAGSPASSADAPVAGTSSPLDDLVRSALRLDGAAVAEAASAQSDRAAAASAIASVQVSAAGGELAYVMCTFFARRMDANATAAPASAAPAAAAASPSAPHAHADAAASPDAAAIPGAVATTGVESGSAASSSEPAPSASASTSPSPAASSSSTPADLLPVLRLLSPSTRSALVASLLAGDRTDAFTHVFAAHKLLLPLDSQRKHPH